MKEKYGLKLEDCVCGLDIRCYELNEMMDLIVPACEFHQSTT